MFFDTLNFLETGGIIEKMVSNRFLEQINNIGKKQVEIGKIERRKDDFIGCQGFFGKACIYDGCFRS